MNKSDLISKMAETAGLSKQQATDALNAALGAIADSLKAGDKVTLVGFGTFATHTRASRQGRNPKTMEPITIEEKTVVRFKPGKDLDRD